MRLFSARANYPNILYLGLRGDTTPLTGSAPHEVNLNYYPTWCGRDHAIILNTHAAERVGVVAALSQGQGGHGPRSSMVGTFVSCDK
jgi:hypothetical protein